MRDLMKHSANIRESPPKIAGMGIVCGMNDHIHVAYAFLPIASAEGQKNFSEYVPKDIRAL